MAHSLVKVKSFQVLDHYQIELLFDDDSRRLIDFQPILIGPLYGPLMDPDIFRQAKIDPVAGTIIWPNGADFDPDTLYNWDSCSESLAQQLRR